MNIFQIDKYLSCILTELNERRYVWAMWMETNGRKTGLMRIFWWKCKIRVFLQFSNGFSLYFILRFSLFVYEKFIENFSLRHIFSVLVEAQDCVTIKTVHNERQRTISIIFDIAHAHTIRTETELITIVSISFHIKYCAFWCELTPLIWVWDMWVAFLHRTNPLQILQIISKSNLNANYSHRRRFDWNYLPIKKRE